MPPYRYNTNRRRTSAKWTAGHCDRYTEPFRSNSSIGVPWINVARLALRRWTFGNELNILTISGTWVSRSEKPVAESLAKPTGDTKTTKMSWCGLWRAADSIAQACLQWNEKNVDDFLHFHEIFHFEKKKTHFLFTFSLLQPSYHSSTS